MDSTKSNIEKEKLSGVVFIRDIPEGFFEHEQRDYFNQFGSVRNVRVLRSAKTNRSRGCAWVRFADLNVAQVAADTMNNYLMGNHLLKCVHLRSDQVPVNVFRVQALPAFWRSRRAAKQQNSHKTTQQMQRMRQRMREHIKRTNHTLATLGVPYEFSLPNTQTANHNKPDVSVVKQESVGDVVDMAAENTMYSLLLDSDDDEIVLRTPPFTRRKSKLSTA